MPVYEYYCGSCESEYELMRPISNMDDPAQCPGCGKPGERLLSYFAFKTNTYGMPKLKPPKHGPFRGRSKEQA